MKAREVIHGRPKEIRRYMGVTEEMLDGIAAGTLAMDGGYKAPNHDEIVEILKASME